MDFFIKTNKTNNDGEKESGGGSPFERKSKLASSPSGATPSNTEKSPMKKNTQIGITATKETISNTKLEEATKLVQELSEFVAARNNVHHDIKRMVTKIQKALLDAGKERKSLEESAGNWQKLAGQKAQSVDLTTPVNRPKRGRQSPESPRTGSIAKKPKSAHTNEESEWKKVKKKKEKKPQHAKEKQRPKTVRPMADALLVGASGETTYADILRKVKNDPNLKGLNDQVARIRRTRNGEMLFELKKDPSAKSSAFKELVEQSLGDAAKVRALSQETMVECRNLDEVTTDQDLRKALEEQFQIGDAAQTAPIRLRKAYGDTQIATIKLTTEVANRLLEKGKVKVGWTVCSIRAMQQPERCYKCMGFGHQAKQCRGTDRSKLCRRCGEEGHISRTCTKPPKCMLCTAEKDRDHVTGGQKCPALKAAMTARRWR